MTYSQICLLPRNWHDQLHFDKIRFSNVGIFEYAFAFVSTNTLCKIHLVRFGILEREEAKSQNENQEANSYCHTGNKLWGKRCMQI